MFLLGPGQIAEPSDRPSDKAREAIPQPHGGALVPGAGGGPQPGSGRKPDAFRELMRTIASKAADTVLEKIAHDDKHPAFLGAAKWSSEHGYGRPVETREYSGTVTVRVVRDTGPIVEPELIEPGE